MYKILLTLFVLLISFTSAKADDCRGDRPQYDEDQEEIKKKKQMT